MKKLVKIENAAGKVVAGAVFSTGTCREKCLIVFQDDSYAELCPESGYDGDCNVVNADEEISDVLNGDYKPADLLEVTLITAEELAASQAALKSKRDRQHEEAQKKRDADMRRHYLELKKIFEPNA